MSSKETFYHVLSRAVKEFAEKGFVDSARLGYWIELLRRMADLHLPKDQVMGKRMKSALTALYNRNVGKKAILRFHPGVEKFTVDRIDPLLRSELDRRVMTSIDLIKVNREQAIEKMVQRFSGWATSQPPGGTLSVDRTEVKEHVWRSLKSMDYEERRLYIDQGHKMIANISATIAHQSGSIAGIWHSHWRAASYNARPEHKERDEKVYAMRGNWAMDKGLMTKGPDGYLDEHEAAGEFVNCRCYITYLYGISELPANMLTQKGRDAIMGYASAKKAV